MFLHEPTKAGTHYSVRVPLEGALSLPCVPSRGTPPPPGLSGKCYGCRSGARSLNCFSARNPFSVPSNAPGFPPVSIPLSFFLLISSSEFRCCEMESLGYCCSRRSFLNPVTDFGRAQTPCEVDCKGRPWSCVKTAGGVKRGCFKTPGASLIMLIHTRKSTSPFCVGRSRASSSLTSLRLRNAPLASRIPYLGRPRRGSSSAGCIGGVAGEDSPSQPTPRCG